jgi:hypothetical protein
VVKERKFRKKGLIPMSETIIIALISLLGTLGGTFGGILATSKLTNYRIEQLEKKVDKHNSIIERTFRLEDNDRLLDEKIKVANHRIDDLENRKK